MSLSIPDGAGGIHGTYGPWHELPLRIRVLQASVDATSAGILMNGAVTVKILDVPGTETTSCRYGVMTYPVLDDPIGVSLHRYGEWAEAEIQFLKQFVFPGATVIDAGAHVGTHSLAMAVSIGDGGRVIAFEPQPQIFALLEANTQSYEFIECRHEAVGASHGTGKFARLDFDERRNTGAFSLLGDVAVAQAGDVNVVRVDDLGLATCQLIKLDVEGMECEAIVGAQRTIDRLRPVVVAEVNSARAAVSVFECRDWAGSGYNTYLARFSAFNPENFRKETENMFGFAEESSLCFVPVERQQPSEECSPLIGLTRIEDMEQAILAVAATPRFGDRGPHDRDALYLSVEVQALNARIQELERLVSHQEQELGRASFRERALEHALIADMQEVRIAVEMRLNSKSWRWTGPLRSARSWLRFVRTRSK